MKKALSLLLALVFLFSIPLPAFSAGKGKISLSGNMKDLRRGISFEVVVELNRNPGIFSLRSTIKFDPKVLEVEKAESLGLLPGFSYEKEEGSLLLRWKKKDKGNDITSRGKIALVTFRVKDDAPYGESTISQSISQKLYDAVNGQGDAVPFETKGLTFSLDCPHENPTLTTVTEETFETAGVAQSICPDCGETKEISILPTLSSEDEKTTVTLHTGEYLNTDEKSIRTVYLFGGDEAQAAQVAFGEDLIRAFRIRLTKNGQDFVPKKKTPVLLETDFEIPEKASLYILRDGTSEKVDMKREGEKITFSYEDAVYALVLKNKTPAPEPEKEESPQVTTTKKEEIPTGTTLPQEEEQENDILIILIGVLVLLICGVAVIFLTRKTKRF